MSIDAVLFDFAGVLTSSPWHAMREAGGGSLELLIGPYDEDTDHPWHRVERGEIPISEWAMEVTRRGEEAGVTVDFAPLRSLLGEMDVHTVVVDRVASLRAEGYKTALITNNVAEASGAWRSLVAVDDLFDVVIDSSAVGMRKPSPEIFQHALAELGGVPPDRAVFLDDTEGNVDGARRAGLHAILVDDPSAAIDELDRLLRAHR
jgi:epoxide hydrolase-like predicted phosphatase